MKELKNWFSKRGYPPKVINEQVNRAMRSEEKKQHMKEQQRQHMKENGVPLVATYNPSFKNLRFLIRKK